VQNLRTEWTLEKGTQSTQHKEMRADIVKFIDSKTSYTNPAHSKIKKEHDLHEFEKQFQAVQERVGQLENKFGDCFNKLVQ
jgi:hypothetical protein